MTDERVEKAVLGSVRLDSDVWAAIRAMPESLNQYLRRELLSRGHRPSKRAQVAAELAASDLTAQVVGREDIDYGSHESLPRGEHVANMRKPLLKPKEKR